MISGIDLKATIDYTLKDDKENPTIWKLGMLPGKVMSSFAMEAKSGINEIEFMYKVLSFGLKGWSNFNQEFKAIKTTAYGQEYDIVPSELLNTIPVFVVGELIEQIFLINKLQKAEIKN